MLAHVISVEGWKPRCSLLTDGNTVGDLVSVTQALIAHSVILNERCCIHQCTVILNTALTLYGDSMIYYIIINNGMNIIK